MYKNIIIIILIICIFYLKKDNFYKNIKDIDKPNKIDVLVNKNNRLNKFYRPYDLVKISEEYSNKDKYLRFEAKVNYEKMSKKAKEEGYRIMVVSSYRSYFYQQELYNYYVKKMGLKKADKASARPGHSEHQTGLSIDIEGTNKDYMKFEESPEFNWMKDNSYKYGFILRYPKSKEYITGFKYEPWHYRYVGKKIAKIIHDNNITLEEYKKLN